MLIIYKKKIKNKYHIKNDLKKIEKLIQCIANIKPYYNEDVFKTSKFKFQVFEF